MLESVLPHIALWGLVFALLNLYVTVDKQLRDSSKTPRSKVAVIIIAVILVGYAVAIGVLAVNALFGSAEMMQPPD